MDSVPSDINTTRKNSGIEGGDNLSGQYSYIPIKKRWIDDNGFVIMAATETAWWSNRIAWSGLSAAWDIKVTTDFTDIILCKDIEKTTADANARNWNCTYKPENDKLRYIYVY